MMACSDEIVANDNDFMILNGANQAVTYNDHDILSIDNGQFSVHGSGHAMLNNGGRDQFIN